MKLLINADDLGYCSERDKGILEGVECGVIKNVSFMVNGENAESAANQTKVLLRSHSFCVGLHINFTEGRPIHSDVPSLVNESGTLLGKFEFREAWHQNLIDPDHILRELDSQIDAFYSLLGFMPHHVDSHQHTHQIPSLAKLLIPTLLKRDVQSIRIPTQASNHQKLSPFLCQVHKESEISKDLFAGFFLCDGFIGLTIMGNSSTDVLEEELNQMMATQQENAIVEWMCHPGYCCDYKDDFSESTEREDELHLLVSKELKEMIARNNIVLDCWPENSNSCN